MNYSLLMTITLMCTTVIPLLLMTFFNILLDYVCNRRVIEFLQLFNRLKYFVLLGCHNAG